VRPQTSREQRRRDPVDRQRPQLTTPETRRRTDLGHCSVSLVTEALDQAADAVLDLAWARQREQLYPAAVKAAAVAASRYQPLSYAERRLAELAAAAPRPGDYTGGPVHRAESARRL